MEDRDWMYGDSYIDGWDVEGYILTIMAVIVALGVGFLVGWNI